MLLQLANYLESYLGFLHAVQYLSLRAILGAITAFGISLLFGPLLVRLHTARNISQSVRALAPQSHQQKSGTPTMGGVLILAAVFSSVLLWGDLSNCYLWLVMIVTLAFGLIGWIDDHRKVTQSSAHGLSARAKFLWQSSAGLAAAGALYCLATAPEHTQLLMPFFKYAALDFGAVGFVLFSYLVIVGSSNAVNLTDGLDGLAIMPVVMIGALALGAALGTLAVITRHEIVFCLMSGIFVLETMSVIVQVASYKLTGRRVFMMAPIHHHFELKGWPEPRVIVRFWIITVMLVLTGLATLKLR